MVDATALDEWAKSWQSTAVLIEAAAAVLTALVAAIAAVYASRQVRLARLDREDRNRPFVTVTLRPSHGIVANIVIKNEGATMARNVRFTFEPEWESTDPDRTAIRDSKVWREGIPNLAPGQEIAMFADTFPDRYKADLPHAYTVEVSCDGRQRRFGRPPRRLSERYVLDFDVFYGYSTATVYEIHDVADALRDVRATMRSWTESGGRRLSVLSRDGDARDATERVEYEQWRARRESHVEEKATEQGVLTTVEMSSDMNVQTPISRPRATRRVRRAANDESE